MMKGFIMIPVGDRVIIGGCMRLTHKHDDGARDFWRNKSVKCVLVLGLKQPLTSS